MRENWCIQQPAPYKCPVLQCSQNLLPRTRLSVLSKCDHSGHPGPFLCSQITKSFSNLLAHKRKRRKLEEERLASVRERFSTGFYGCHRNHFFCLYIFRTAASFWLLVAGMHTMEVTEGKSLTTSLTQKLLPRARVPLFHLV